MNEIKVYDMVTKSEVYKMDIGLSDLINHEIKSWIKYDNPDLTDVSEIVLLFGPNDEYIAGIGVTLMDAIRSAQNTYDSEEDQESVILEINRNYFPYRVKIGLSLQSE